MDTFKTRCDQAKREGRRLRIGIDTTDPQDIEAAFRKHNIIEPSAEPSRPVLAEVERVSAEELERWYVLFINPSADTPRKVEDFVARQGFPTYYPKSVRLVVRGRGRNRKKVEERRPLIHRYVLVKMRQVQDRHGNRGFPFGRLTSHEGKFNGIREYLGSALGPQAIDEVLVDHLKGREQAGEFDATVKKGRKTVRKFASWLTAGALVRIKEGPFGMLNGFIEAVDEVKERVQITISLFGRATPIELGIDEVECLG